ncbi:MAG: hypothetical protein QME85_00180 [Candidatus Saccharicenans sp.]|nr:hypothetical protein [Candidatus Saccharicenans sp.]
MKKALVSVISILLVLGILSGLASAWERGTHAFIAHKLKKASGPYDIEEMYGAMAPDAFNYLFTPPYILYRDFLYDQTHHHFLKIQYAVKYGYEKASSYGFISHNNLWGADSTAHIASLTLLPDEGYVITKAKALDEYLKTVSPDYYNLFKDFPAVALEVCHNIIEAAGDIVLVRYDRSLGAKIMQIAARPKTNMQNLMVRAYAKDLADFSQGTATPMTREEAEMFIRVTENEFRTSCIAYGWLLQQDELIILENVIEQFKELAVAYLTAVGLPVPDEPLLTALLEGSFKAAIGLIENDYLPEIIATIDMLKRAMVKEVKPSVMATRPTAALIKSKLH